MKTLPPEEEEQHFPDRKRHSQTYASSLGYAPSGTANDFVGLFCVVPTTEGHPPECRLTQGNAKACHNEVPR